MPEALSIKLLRGRWLWEWRVRRADGFSVVMSFLPRLTERSARRRAEAAARAYQRRQARGAHRKVEYPYLGRRG